MLRYDQVLNSLHNLEHYVKTHDYSGYDPYDALNSKSLRLIKSKILRLVITQLFVYSPINCRKFFNIEPYKNPKAIGLFLSSYCNLFKNGLIKKKDFNDMTSKLVDYILEMKSNGYSGLCWGFNFDWQDLKRFSEKWLPTIVVTSYVGNSFLDLYEITKEKKYQMFASKICSFILNDLNISKNNEGVCFSYTPIDRFIVHNANCLGASFLSRVYSITKENELLDYSKKAFNYSLSYQKNNGSWAYSQDSITKKERNQLDFHQGFILDSIINFIKYTKEKDKKYVQSLMKGINFYINQQFENYERSKWRLPWRYPVDIHNQAQGIITLSKMYSMFGDEKYLDFAKTIADWTMDKMQDESGFFYYQKWPFFTNKISYMRWNQAWMMFALTNLLDSIKNE